MIWEQRFNDFLSDTVYERYSIGSPVIDRETGNVYVLTTAGEFVGFTGDGEPLWGHSMMEDYGRLTFPNGRVGSPVIDDDLIIVPGITSNWGLQGQAADRSYALNGHGVRAQKIGCSSRALAARTLGLTPREA